MFDIDGASSGIRKELYIWDLESEQLSKVCALQFGTSYFSFAGAVRPFSKDCGHQVLGGGEGELSDHLLGGPQHQSVGPELHL